VSPYLPILGTVFTLCLMACASPGPNFLTVSSAAVGRSRRHAVLTALGIMSGDTIWAIAAILGFSALLAAFPVLQVVLTVGGGLYLAYVGFCLWRSNGAGSSGQAATSGFFPAMMVSLTNPKAPIYLASIFAPILTPGTPDWVQIAGIATVATSSVLWYVTVALALSNEAAQRSYRRYGTWIDRAAGTLLIGFGVWLVVGSL
jgi:threonine/homoserine/homoserine lactone efflux protein